MPSAEKLYETELAILKGNELIQLIHDLSLGKKTFCHTLKFKEALNGILRMKELNFQEFKDRIIKKLDIIHPCTTIDAYKELLVGLYNYSKRGVVLEFKPGQRIKMVKKATSKEE